MGDKISLPDGGWAMLRDPKQVTERQRRPIDRLQAKINASQIGAILFEQKRRIETGEDKASVDRWFEEQYRQLQGTPDYDLLDEYNDALIVAFVDSWSYDLDVSAYLDLPGQVYTALKDACAPLANASTVTFDPGQAADPQSPTGSPTE